MELSLRSGSVLGNCLEHSKEVSSCKRQPKEPVYTLSKEKFNLAVVLVLLSEYALPGIISGLSPGLKTKLMWKVHFRKTSCLMFIFISGWVNHFDFDIMFGFLLFCTKQWLERNCFFPLLKTIFRTVEAILMKNIFIMPRAFLKFEYLYKRLTCQFNFSTCKSNLYKSNRRYFGGVFSNPYRFS